MGEDKKFLNYNLTIFTQNIAQLKNRYSLAKQLK